MARARPYDRDQALDAALRLFWRKGYHATSLKDLEAALNMKPGSIYAAFTSKEALYLASLERYFERGRAGMQATVTGAATPLAGLAAQLRAYGRSGPGTEAGAEDRACMLVKTILGTTSDEPAIAARARQYLDAMRDEIRGYFESARNQGHLPADADTDRLAQRYQADVTALRIEAQRGVPAPDLANLAEDMARAVEALDTRAQQSQPA